MNLTISLFGPFKNYFENDSICIEVESGDIQAVKRALYKSANRMKIAPKIQALISVSVFADDSKILHDDDEISGTSRLSLLPPVCGG